MAILLTCYGKYYNIEVHNLQGAADFKTIWKLMILYGIII
jgi:hypothetical protein